MAALFQVSYNTSAGCGFRSHLGGFSVVSGAAGASPRSASSWRVGQAGYSMGLAKLASQETIAGKAAVVLQTMASAMDHLLERGPMPGSPFLQSRRLASVALSMASSGTIFMLSQSP
jgi:hypothetical protein